MSRKLLVCGAISVVVLCCIVSMSLYWIGSTSDASKDAANARDDVAILFSARHAEKLPMPVGKAIAVGAHGDAFALSPNGKQLGLAIGVSCRLHIYTAAFPPQDASAYREVVDTPNISSFSPIAWCREDHTRLAFAAHCLTGVEIPQFDDAQEFSAWAIANRGSLPAGKLSTIQADKRITRRIGIVSTQDNSLTTDIEFPVTEGVTDMGSLCWPRRDTIFYQYGRTIYRVTVGTQEPSVSAVYVVEDANTLILSLGFDSASGLLYCFKMSSRQEAGQPQDRYELLSLTESGEIVKTIGMPFPGLPQSVAYSKDGTSCLVLEIDSVEREKGTLHRCSFATNQWEDLLLASDTNVPSSMLLKAYDSEEDRTIVGVWGRHDAPYYLWTLQGEQYE